MSDGLKPLLLEVLTAVTAIKNDHGRQLAEQGQQLAEIRAEQKRLADAQDRMEGQMSVMLAWLQSTDQRFAALMAPVSPPRKPAA